MSEIDIKYGHPEDVSEFYHGAWNVLHENPGCDFEKWTDILSEQYPLEIIDEFGANEVDLMNQLRIVWNGYKYFDPITKIDCTYKEWSEYFSSEKSTELYDLLINQKGI